MVTTILGSNLVIGVLTIGALLALAWRWRDGIGAAVGARQAAWRGLAWLGLGATSALALWGTLADSWRKLVGEALDINERYASQRLVQEPVPHAIRLVTLALLAVSLLTLAPLLARYVGGYGVQLVLVLVGLTTFFPLYALRQRFDTFLATIDHLPALLSFAMVATAIFIALDYATNVALLLLTYLGLLGLVALPVTLLLDLLRQREPPPDPEPVTFYASLRENLVARRAAPPGQPAPPAEPTKTPTSEPPGT